ncbi:hypothetical protein FR943_11480 [Mycobacterium sp. TNTM28]|uniref:DUF4878 domain-containing protein n=1 Tax=[Mycobacterium] fortunisiensis TaxID=2600579 RepID=A0ABS6KLK3_9MYCO|nr:hypothetical protein [[Mycobacterium] fortunisiensis]MBU9764462.1 hypothetical protein [[Mycobacterium] fortunisiensis]
MTYPPSNPPTPPSGPPEPWQQPYQQGGPQGYPSGGPTPEQPYGAPSGAPQPGQQPYGQPYGAPYGGPQQPQPPYGAPYGVPQPGQPPYGAPYGAQPPYGAPQQPYGYPAPTPPGGGNGKWLAIGAAVLAVVILIGGIAIFALSGDSDSNSGRNNAGSSQSSGGKSSGGSSNESDEQKEVREFLQEVMSSSSDLKDALPYFCQADQDLFEKFGGLDAIDIPHSTDPSGTAEITKITVNGSKAVVDISTSAGPGKFYLRKESGSWKICMSDMPGMPSMP